MILIVVAGWITGSLTHALIAGMLILHQLDKTHGSGACCSWPNPVHLPEVGMSLFGASISEGR